MRLIEIGRIVRPHGLAGHMKVASYLESPNLLSGLAGLYVGRNAADAVLRPIVSVKAGKNSFILKIRDVEDRNAVEALIGYSVWINSEIMKKLPEGEYYWCEVIGLQVLTEQGECLGRVEAIFPTGGNDVYVCRSEGREILLPAVSDVIRKIDVDRGIIVVRLLEGLVAHDSV